MFERVLDHRVGIELAHKLGSGQRRESGLEVGLGKVDNLAEHRYWEILADDRSGLQDLLLAIGESIDARREHGVHMARHGELVELGDQPEMATFTDQAPQFDQRLHNLFSKKRVATGASVDAFRKTLGARLVAERSGGRRSSPWST